MRTRSYWVRTAGCSAGAPKWNSTERCHCCLLQECFICEVLLQEGQ